MFGKLMNRYYYGKSGKGDYTPEDLPKNRWQLFWEMLRVRFFDIMKLNLLYMLFWIPVIIVIGLGFMSVIAQTNELATLQDQIAAGEALQSEYDALAASMPDNMLSLLYTTLLLLWPALTITGPFTAGASYVTRNWARDEHSFMVSDFWQAVKENWKPSILCSFITGAIPFLMYVCISFYGQMAEQNTIFMIPEMLTIVVGLVWMCAVMYMYPQIVSYKLNFRGVVRNSLLMAIGKLPFTVGLKLLSVVPALLLAFFCFFTSWGIYAILVYGLYYIILGFGLSRFVNASYTNGVFDKYLNSKIEGAQVGRGLYVETDEDEDEEAGKNDDDHHIEE